MRGKKRWESLLGSGAGLEKLLRQMKLYGAAAEDLVVTVEATGNYWNELVWALTSRGCCVYLAQPKKAHDLRKFYRDHTKTDITDSAALARMPLVDEGLRAVWVPSPGEQILLRLCRLRWKYRCRIADLKRRISNLSEMVVPGLDRVTPGAVLEEREALTSALSGSREGAQARQETACADPLESRLGQVQRRESG